MGKGANKGLMKNAGIGQTRSNALNKKGNALYGFVDPLLEAEATNPQGYGAGDLAAMNTASQQSSGGAVSGITGQANLTAARTRNAGGFQGAVGSGTRAAMRNNAQNAVEIQAQNAQLKEAQKQQAISQIMDLYHVNEETALGYLNASTGAYSAENQSHPLQSGFKTFADVLNAIKGNKGPTSYI